MRITVKLFSYLRQIAGTDQVSVDLSEPARIEDLLNVLGDQFNDSNFKNDQMAIMVNHKNVFLDTPLKDGDQVLLLPIMDGG